MCTAQSNSSPFASEVSNDLEIMLLQFSSTAISLTIGISLLIKYLRYFV